MALIGKNQKACEAVLLQLKEAVCRNPETDVAPYTRMLLERFKKWNSTSEKGVISMLCLSLYAQDGPSLRRDLCRLEPRDVLCRLESLDTAKARFPMRGLLLNCLYGELSLYTGGFTGEEFALTVRMCGEGVDVGRKKYEEVEQKEYAVNRILSKFKEAVCHNPDQNVNPYLSILINAYNMMRTVCIERVINTLLLKLYAQDAAALKRDILKCRMMRFGTLSGEQRAELLSHLYGALASYIGEDFSPILKLCG